MPIKRKRIKFNQSMPTNGLLYILYIRRDIGITSKQIRTKT